MIRVLTLSVASIALAACTASPSKIQSVDSSQAWFDSVDLASYLDCAREQDVTLLQAHRAGDRPGAAENSLEAINASLADGSVFIEFDVARTMDGVLVLMHDRTLDRTTTGQGHVTEMRYADFAALQLVDVDGEILEEAPPSFEAAIDALNGRGVAQVDLKGVDMPTIAAAIDAADAAERAIVITYSIEDAIMLHQALPEVMLSVGVRSLDDLARLDAADVDLTRVQAWLGLGTGDPELDAALAERGIETSYGDFRGEREGSVDYQLMADNGAEVISVDDVPAAAAALDAGAQARALLAACPAARP